MADFRQDPKAFIWFYGAGFLCAVLRHKESDLLGALPLLSEGRVEACCLRCGDNKVNGAWMGRP